MQQRSDEWHFARIGHITGSRAPAVFSRGRAKADKWGQAAKTLMDTLLAELLTGIPESFVPVYEFDAEVSVEVVTGWKQGEPPRACKWGTLHEAEALRVYAQRTSADIEPADFITLDSERFIGVSPDGLVGDDTVVEVKCPATSKEFVRLVLSGEVPAEHMIQMRHACWVTGRSFAAYVVYDPRMPDGADMLAIPVVFSESDIAEHAERVLEFREMLLQAAQTMRSRNVGPIEPDEPHAGR